MFSITIIKTDNHSIDLIDIVSLYRSCEVLSGNKLHYIAAINKSKNSLILSPKNSNNPDDLYEEDLKFCKLMLRSVKSLTTTEIQTIFSILFNAKELCQVEQENVGFQCHSGDKGMVIDFSDGLLNIYASVNNVQHHLNTLPFVHSFLISRKIDIFGLLKGGYAALK